MTIVVLIVYLSVLMYHILPRFIYTGALRVSLVSNDLAPSRRHIVAATAPHRRQAARRVAPDEPVPYLAQPATLSLPRANGRGRRCLVPLHGAELSRGPEAFWLDEHRQDLGAAVRPRVEWIETLQLLRCTGDA